MRATMTFLAVLLLSAAVAAEELPELGKQWDWNDLEKTEKRFRDLAEKAKKAGNLDYELQALTQAARTFGMRGRFEEGHAILDDVEKRLTEATQVARIRYLLERGRTLNSSGDADGAKPLFLEAFERAKKIGHDPLAVDAVHMVAIVVPVEEQLEWNLRALELVTGSEDERVKGWLGPLYHNIGMTYLDQGKLEEALRYFMKDYEYRLGASEDPEPIRIAKWCVAHTLRKMGRLAPALRMQREMEVECAESGRPDGFVCEEIAEILLAQGKKDEAKPYFRRAFEALRDVDWVREGDPDRLSRLRKLGEE